MPETETQGEGWATLEAKIIRADGTEEDLGVIAKSTFDGSGIQDAMNVEMAALRAQLDDPEPPDGGEE